MAKIKSPSKPKVSPKRRSLVKRSPTRVVPIEEPSSLKTLWEVISPLVTLLPAKAAALITTLTALRLTVKSSAKPSGK